MSMRRQKFLLFRVYRFRDTSAYAQLYDEYFSKIRRYVYFRVPRSEDTDELTAEVFLRGWEYTTSSKVDNPGALFYRIAQNLIADFYRKETSTDAITDEMQIPDSRDELKEAANKSEQDQLLRLLKKLKDEYREILVMRYLDEMSIKEISLIIEKTPNNVRVLLHRAKNALRELKDKNNG